MSPSSKSRVLRSLKRIPADVERPSAKLKQPLVPVKSIPASPTPDPFETPRKLLRNLPPPTPPPRSPLPARPSTSPCLTPVTPRRLTKKPSKIAPTTPTRSPQYVEEVTAPPVASSTLERIDNAMNCIASMLGGYDRLDIAIASYCPSLYAFVAESSLSRAPIVNRPAKLAFILGGLGMLQATIPAFAWPVDVLIRVLGTAFILFLGLRSVQLGFSASAFTRGLLVTSLLTTAVDLIPAELLDLNKHLGGLRSIWLPLALLLSPPGMSTLAVSIAEAATPYLAETMAAIHPSKHFGVEWRTKAFFAGAGIVALFWGGYLGEQGAYLTVWCVLAFQTVQALCDPPVQSSESTPNEVPNSAEIHNIQAIWTWRMLLSAAESVELPGVVSTRDCLTYYLPGYYLWMTAIFAAMLIADKRHTETTRGTPAACSA